MPNEIVTSRLRLFPLLFAALLALLSGCATPPSYRQAASFDLNSLRSVVILPIDVEVSELSAGGTIEKRDDWTAQVVEHINAIVLEQYHYRHAFREPADVADDLARTRDELAPLYRAISLNQVLHTYNPAFPRVSATTGPLGYQTGSLAAFLEKQKADAVLIVYVRDDYATAGRKSLAVLGVIAGIPIRTGVTGASAALVNAKGDLVWMNIHAAQTGDLRTRQGAETLVARLLVGAPKLDTANAKP